MWFEKICELESCILHINKKLAGVFYLLQNLPMIWNFHIINLLLKNVIIYYPLHDVDTQIYNMHWYPVPIVVPLNYAALLRVCTMSRFVMAQLDSMLNLNTFTKIKCIYNMLNSWIYLSFKTYYFEESLNKLCALQLHDNFTLIYSSEQVHIFFKFNNSILPFENIW